MEVAWSEHKYSHVSDNDNYHEALSSSTSSLTSDLPLVSRIRALLLSRNSNYPPRTPCPSPEFSTLSRNTNTPNTFEPGNRNISSSNFKQNLRKTALLRRTSTASVVMSDISVIESSDGIIRSKSAIQSPDSPVSYAQSLDIDIVKAILKVEQSLLNHDDGGDTKNNAFDSNLFKIRFKKRRYSQTPSPQIVRAVTVSKPRLVSDSNDLRHSISPSLSSTGTISNSETSTIQPLLGPKEAFPSGVAETRDKMEEKRQIIQSDTVEPLVVRRKPRGASLNSYYNPPSPYSRSQGELAFKAFREIDSRQGSVRHLASSPLAEYLNVSGIDNRPSLTSLDHRSACSVMYVSAMESPAHSKPPSMLDKKCSKAKRQKRAKRSAMSPPKIPVRKRKPAYQQPFLNTAVESHSPVTYSIIDSPSIYSRSEDTPHRTPPKYLDNQNWSVDDESAKLVVGDTLERNSLDKLETGTTSHTTNNAQDTQRKEFESANTDTGIATISYDLHSATQNEILELIQKANRAKAALFMPSESRQQSWDLQSAQEWISQFIRKSFSKDDFNYRDENLTARASRSGKSYYEQYQSRKHYQDVRSPLTHDGGRSRIPSQDVERLNQRALASFKNNRLEQVVSELESVLEEALAMATEAADANDIELQKELQDITSSLKSPDITQTIDKAQLRQDPAKLQPKATKPEGENLVTPAKMKRVEKDEETVDEAQFHKRIQDYHRTLTKLHDTRIIDSRRHSVSTDSQLGNSTTINLKPMSSPKDPTRATIPRRQRANTSPPLSPLGQGQTQFTKVPVAQLRTDMIGSLDPFDTGHATQVRRAHTVPYSPGQNDSSQSDWQAPSEWERRTPGPSPVHSHDWATGRPMETSLLVKSTSFREPMAVPNRTPPPVPVVKLLSGREQQNNLVRSRQPTSADIKSHILVYKQPLIQQRRSSRKQSILSSEEYDSSDMSIPGDVFSEDDYIADFDDSNQLSKLIVDGTKTRVGSKVSTVARNDFVPDVLSDTEVEGKSDTQMKEIPRTTSRRDTKLASSDFYKHRHLSFRGRAAFSLYKSHKRAPIARDWSKERKRFVASISCISTALIGLIIGMYAGEAPAIQYALVDEHHRYTYLGNVFLYLGLALSNIMFWPLPLLHGRKPYTVSALVVALPLLFPQALVVTQQRDPDNSLFRIGLLLPRFIAGLALGFAQTNFFGVLLDVFGSSLMSANPHQEIVNPYDVRRHGGGMGAWLSIWTWCYIGSIGLGFFVGALITEWLNVAWGFWIAIFCTVVVILLNVIAPETRRSSYRRSMAEVRNGNDVSRRIARGEIMMHLYSTGPKHWWQEMLAGWVLCIRLSRQIGFSIVVIYQAWIYGQVVMVMILLGALTSKYYHLHPHAVALCVASFPLGALVAIPFQKASLFSRARHRPQRSDSMTYKTGVVWTSHMARRTTFMVLLPLAGLAYTLSSTGVKTPLALPVLFSAAIGFLSNLALSECAGMLMEDYDTSDLQPGMTGRPRTTVSDEDSKRRTNFSCFPRVTAAFAIVQSLSFCIAAAATACGGNVERHLGAQYSTAVVASVLLLLTLFLVVALLRVKEVQMVPSKRVPTAILSGPGDDLPVIIGSPSGTARRVSLLELGNMTRWSEIRRRNKLLK